MSARPEIDVVDSTWMCVRPARLAAIIADPGNWRRWWPQLDLAVEEWRGEKGVRWTVRSAGELNLAGSMEVWLEAVDDGVVAHYFLRLDGTAGALGPRRAERIERQFRSAVKQVFWGLADRLDPGRIARIGSAGTSGRL